MKKISTYHLVKTGDLNHHRTLYAGRAADWILEAGWLAAADAVSDSKVVCAKIGNMQFFYPIHAGETVRIDSTVAYAGRSSLICYVSAEAGGTRKADGFICFVHVDEWGKAQPHGVQVEAVTEEEKMLQERAKQF